MNINRKNPRHFDAAEDLRACIRVAPWLTLAIMRQWTDEQWKNVTSGQCFLDLLDDLERIADKLLAKYAMLSRDSAEDVAGDLLLKLLEGKFLKSYACREEKPRAYLMGCGRQLARVIVRSRYRDWRRDNGLPPDAGVLAPKKGPKPMPPLSVALVEPFERQAA